MQVHTPAIENGVFHDRFGKRSSDFSPNGMPSRSIPFSISDAPAGTQSYAVVLDDKDAVTAAGFVWIHWLIADLTATSVPENDSIAAQGYTQGANSWASVLGVEINSVVYTFRILDADKFGGFRRLSRMPQGTAKPHGS